MLTNDERYEALKRAVIALHESTQVVHVGGGMVRVDVLMVSSDRMAELYDLAARSSSDSEVQRDGQ